MVNYIWEMPMEKAFGTVIMVMRVTLANGDKTCLMDMVRLHDELLIEICRREDFLRWRNMGG